MWELQKVSKKTRGDGGICLYLGYMEWYVAHGIYCGMMQVCVVKYCSKFFSKTWKCYAHGYISNAEGPIWHVKLYPAHALIDF